MANSERCECVRELCRVVAETCGQASFVAPLVELGFALTCAKAVVGGTAYEDLNISRQDCMLQKSYVKGLSTFVNEGRPSIWKIRVGECQIALDLVSTFLWNEKISEDETLMFLNARAVFEDLKLLLDFALEFEQARNIAANEFLDSL